MSEHANQESAIAAKAAYDRKAWADACRRYLAADHDHPLSPDDLQRAAWAAHLSGRDDDSDALSQRAIHGYEEAADPEPAALGAWWLGMKLMQRGDMAQAGGWFARAGRLVEGRDSPVHGYLAVPMGLGQLFGGDPAGARPNFEFALETGERFADSDLRTLGRLGLGQVSVDLGDDASGLALLDEAMLSVTAGEASPVVTGIVYCAVIEVCHLLFDLRRAREWTAALGRWCDSQPELVPFKGKCMVHRAEVMTFNGAWASATDEIARACVQLAETHDFAVADALYQRAELCRLRGQFEEAEAFYTEASDRGRQPQPGLALLRLAQGDSVTAAAALRRALAEDHPPLERARLIAPYVEVLLATDDVSEAGIATAELAAIAGRVTCPYLDALAARAAGAVALADGAAAQAINLLRSAWSIWCDLEVPYEAARTRVLIGLACRELGDEESAELDLRAARHAFADLGASSEIVRVDELLHAPVAHARPAATTLTGREVEVLQLVAAGKTNREIAQALVISEKTVARHVSNIFVKISVSSRSAATGYAYQHGLT